MLFLKRKKFVLFIFGCVGSLSLHGPLYSGARGPLSSCGVWAGHCSGFCREAWALGMQASVVVAHGLGRCSSWVPECGLQ